MTLFSNNDENVASKSRIRIQIRIRYLEVRVRGSGFVPKCHGSPIISDFDVVSMYVYTIFRAGVFPGQRPGVLRLVASHRQDDQGGLPRS
jgi:hypothetical protein